MTHSGLYMQPGKYNWPATTTYPIQQPGHMPW